LLLDRIAANDTGTLKNAFICGLPAREAACVRRSRFCAGGGTTRFYQQKRLAIRNLLRLAYKRIALCDALKITCDDSGLRVLVQNLYDVQFVDVGLVANAYELAEPNTICAGDIRIATRRAPDCEI